MFIFVLSQPHLKSRNRNNITSRKYNTSTPIFLALSNHFLFENMFIADDLWGKSILLSTHYTKIIFYFDTTNMNYA